MSGIIIFTLSLLYLSPFIASIAVTDGGDSFSAYEILQSFDFPVGILPKGAKGYDLDETTGKFHAYFNGACSFSLEGSYQLRYKSTISGSISKDRLTNLSGVSVKVLFLWLNIVEVVRNGDVLEFSVGIASAKFTIESFDVSPQCGCGFNCNNIVQVTKLRRSAFVSSLTQKAFRLFDGGCNAICQGNRRNPRVTRLQNGDEVFDLETASLDSVG
ncbi:hypothetical protein RJ639_045546, partial [Escallonia herrerae]